MRVYPQSVFEGEIYPTKDGDLLVLKYVNANEVQAKFLSTGYIKMTTAGNIRKGAVKDPYRPSTFGVGYLGFGDHKANSRRHRSKAYECWHSMIQRCYSIKYQERHPWYAGCTVDPRWHNFQTFADWYYDNYVTGYELDKDTKYFGNKVYSPDNCVFIPPSVNRSHKSSYTLRNRGSGKLTSGG